MTLGAGMLLLAGVGALVVAALGLAFLFEGFVRMLDAIERTLLTRPVTRRDFLAPAYHDYVNWVEDWSRPMFQYIPVGLRHFNLDNPIPRRVVNNSLGFRCDELTRPDPDTFCVVLLGGSAAWGSGASTNEATIAGQLEAIINSDGKLLGANRRAKCYNLAQVNGYQTQDILTLVFFVPRIRPDLVLSFTGWNELMANYPMRADYLEKYGVFYMDEMEGWEPLGVVGNKNKLLKEALALWATDKSALARRLVPSEASAKDGGVISVQERLALGTRLFREHFVMLNTLGRAYGFEHFQFMQPYLYRKRHLTESEKQVIYLYDHVRPVHGGEATGDYLRTHNIYAPLLASLVDNGSGAPNGPVIDLCDVFRDERDTMFYTLVHLTDPGYRKIAEHMYQALVEARERSRRPDHERMPHGRRLEEAG